MKTWFNRGLALALVMFAAAVLGHGIKPTAKAADHLPKLELETVVPREFADWRVDESIIPILPSADVQAELNKIYNQTLARTYVNRKGERIMLSIAYGGDQSDNLIVHIPEGCYGGQGFEVLKRADHVVQVGSAGIPGVRFLARKRERLEPVTYWIVVGDGYARSIYEHKLAQMRATLSRKIPEGVLVRVSSLGVSPEAQYELQDNFLRQMLAAAEPPARRRISGLD